MTDAMDEWYGKPNVIQRPTEERPWAEFEYANPSDYRRFVTFINDVDNIALLGDHRRTYCFRGQACAKWTLKPKLFRVLEGMPLPDALEREFEAIRYFQERAHLFVQSSVPERDNLKEWLCLMQHFCAPTRMLDWTSSFVVALYFAVMEEPVDPGPARTFR